MTAPERPPAFDPLAIRADFPALGQRVAGHALSYLDNAATTQKPRRVLLALERAYAGGSANVHRGAHALGARASDAYELARRELATFLGADDSGEIVFTAGCTAALNLVAQSHGDACVMPGDEVIVSGLEHHSNLLPWRALCQRRGAALREIPLDDQGCLRLDAFAELLGPRTRIVAVSHVSNVLGTVSPLRRISDMAHAVGARVVVDGAQAAPRMPIDVSALGCDFYAVSGHKLYGPFGIGALYARRELLEQMAPVTLGGGMAREVLAGSESFVEPPGRFEAGTPNVAGAIALAEAVRYLTELGMSAVCEHDRDLTAYCRAALLSVPGVVLVGSAGDALGVVSFVHPDVHPHDLSTVCDSRGVAIRAGHHCAQPVMRRYGVVATARASFGVYNTRGEVDALIAAVRAAVELFAA